MQCEMLHIQKLVFAVIQDCIIDISVWDSQCYWKKYSDFGGGKKKSVSEFLSCNLMLNSGKKICALCDKKNKYNSPEKKFWMKQKTITPPAR